MHNNKKAFLGTTLFLLGLFAAQLPTINTPR